MTAHTADLAPDLGELEQRLEQAMAGFALRLGRRPEAMRILLSVPRGRALLADMERRLGPLTGKRILEIGSGCGLALALANTEFGADAWGVDPAQAGYDGVITVAHGVLDRYRVDRERLLCAAGEALPVASAQFDVVYSFFALEHIQNVPEVLHEAVRVLKPGGYLYLVAPNYGSIWEGHYGIPWIPYLPKLAARFYVRLLGRSDEPLQDLNLLTVSDLADAVAETGALLEGLGLSEFEQRLYRANVADLDTAQWVAPVLRFLGAPFVSALVVTLVAKLRLWTPLVVVAHRPGDAE